MTHVIRFAAVVLLAALMAGAVLASAVAQENADELTKKAQETTEQAGQKARESLNKAEEKTKDALQEAQDKAKKTLESAEEKAKETYQSAKEKTDEIAKKLDESEKAKEVAAGILKPIYQLAEQFSFPAFHWIAFAVMVAGVVSFALQLTLGKLLVLARMGFSPAEILSDALGLVVSLVGLVLTTQAATENSTFTSSAAAVLSATAVGAIAGFIFYIWGQRQELQAVEGRRKGVAVKVEQK